MFESSLSLTSCCLSDTVRGQREKCVRCTSTQVPVCSLQVCVADMGVSCLDWVVEEEKERIYVKNLKSDRIPLGIVDLDARLLFSPCHFSTAGSRRGRTAAAFIPASFFPPECLFCASAAHAWLNPSYRCLEEIGIAVEGSKKSHPPKKKKRKEKGVKVF